MLWRITNTQFDFNVDYSKWGSRFSQWRVWRWQHSWIFRVVSWSWPTFRRFLLPHHQTMIMDAVCACETSANFYKTPTRRSIPEGCDLQCQSTSMLKRILLHRSSWKYTHCKYLYSSSVRTHNSLQKQVFFKKRGSNKKIKQKRGEARTKKSNAACHYSVIKRVNEKEEKTCRKMEALFAYKW
jgi:hypothetical protein